MALTTNLVSYWKLDESSGNAADSAGSNTLTNNNTGTYSSGKINNGFDIAVASSQSLSISDGSQSGLDLANLDFSFSLWVKISDTNPGGSATWFLISKMGGGGANQYDCFYTKDAGAGHWYLVNDISTDGTAHPRRQVDLGTSPVISSNTWTHVVITSRNSDGTATFYINGSSQGSQTTTPGSLFNGGAAFEIGTNAFEGPNSSNNLSFDEVGVWSRELSGAEVTELYNGGAGVQYPFTTNVSASDSTAVSDSASIVSVYAPSVADSVSLVETANISLAYPLGVSDTTVVSDSITGLAFIWPNESLHSSSWAMSNLDSSIWTDAVRDSSTFTALPRS